MDWMYAKKGKTSGGRTWKRTTEKEAQKKSKHKMKVTGWPRIGFFGCTLCTHTHNLRTIQNVQ
jgi:hypothetical protein